MPISPPRVEVVPIHQAGEEEEQGLQEGEEELQGLREEVEGRSNSRRGSVLRVWVSVRSVELPSSSLAWAPQEMEGKGRRKGKTTGLGVLGDVLGELASMISGKMRVVREWEAVEKVREWERTTLRADGEEVEKEALPSTPFVDPSREWQDVRDTEPQG